VAAGDEHAEVAHARRVARLLDASLGIPGTRVRIGLDPLLGLVPGVGDLLGLALSATILARARRLGVRRRTLARMAGNLAIDTLVGAVPIAGDLFDAWFRANQRNVDLLARGLAGRSAAPRSSRARTAGAR